jgi:predicted SprT family Zn-dependent metalloprotease
MGRHLPTWTFGFDHARARVGCCHYATHQITLSRYLIAHLGVEDVDQAILHEVAHALAGPSARHGPAWRALADGLGYSGHRTIDVPDARAAAHWGAVCPRGHEHLRHRRPPAGSRCGPCARAGENHVLVWTDRRQPRPDPHG